MKNSHIKMLSNITKVLSLDEFDIYIAKELNITLSHIDISIKIIILCASKPNEYKYIETGKNPIKNENVKIILCPNNFPVKISNRVILYDNIKSRVPDSLSDNIESYDKINDKSGIKYICKCITDKDNDLMSV